MSHVLLRHSKLRLALHRLKEGSGRPLLLLHGLGERTPARLPEELAAWAGPVVGLDFTGHGLSDVPTGGGYTAEILMADADTALRHLGQATLVGRGLGAYVALLLAGARAEQVRGAVLRDGPGLAGGGPRPPSPTVVAVDREALAPPDPFALAELSRDVRPPDYATSFARLAVQLSGLAPALTITSVERPPWLQAVAEEPGVEEARLADALAGYTGV